VLSLFRVFVIDYIFFRNMTNLASAPALSCNTLTKLLVIGLLLVFSPAGIAISVSLASPDIPDQNQPENNLISQPSSKSWYENIESQWGGQFKVRGSASWPDDDSIYHLIDSGPLYDGSADFRLKNKTYLNNWIYSTIHYEAVLYGGDTMHTQKKLEELFPNLFEDSLMPGGSINDDRRFFDLTKIIDEDDSHILYHRLDRFSLTLQPAWGTIRIGRQALTWGNGLLFNPMDLFNPFAPTDIERDYKVGDDMVTTQFTIDKIGGIQLLYVPRRDPADHNVKWSSSSLAGKFHFAAGTTEFDIMVAHHYEDFIAGIGSTGYFMDSAWRLDATWTFLDEDTDRDGFLSLVANIDYSWAWWKKNFYGFMEFYFNGIGDENYSKAISDPAITERLIRGDLFVLGRKYLSTGIEMELHPLIKANLTVISNIADPSGIIQPHVVFDLTEEIQCTIGGNIYCGPSDTEFGGFNISGTDYLYKSPNSAYLRLTYFF
jgi:hypothetical protein